MPDRRFSAIAGIDHWSLDGRKAAAGLALALVMTLCAGCERAPAAESLREWSAADHHSSDDGKQGQRAPATAESARRSGGDDVVELVDITWRQQCTTCHGSLGKGDGQMGPMVHAPDLTRPEWQSTITDGEMVSIIRAGKNRMPKFDLPDTVLAGLVARIRSLRGR